MRRERLLKESSKKNTVNRSKNMQHFAFQIEKVFSSPKVRFLQVSTFTLFDPRHEFQILVSSS